MPFFDVGGILWILPTHQINIIILYPCIKNLKYLLYMVYNMDNETFMRADKELLEKLRKMKSNKKESYADVVRKLIEKEIKK